MSPSGLSGNCQQCCSDWARSTLAKVDTFISGSFLFLGGGGGEYFPNAVFFWSGLTALKLPTRLFVFFSALEFLNAERVSVGHNDRWSRLIRTLQSEHVLLGRGTDASAHFPRTHKE